MALKGYILTISMHRDVILVCAMKLFTRNNGRKAY